MWEMLCSDLDVATVCASNSIVNRYYRYTLAPRVRFGPSVALDVYPKRYTKLWLCPFIAKRIAICATL